MGLNYISEVFLKTKIWIRGKKIFEIYKQDLDMFGYYWDYKTNEIDFEIVNK